MRAFLLYCLFFGAILGCASKRSSSSIADGSQPTRPPIPVKPNPNPTACKLLQLPVRAPQSFLGSVKLGGIPQLAPNWWKLADVDFPVGWDPNTVYLWGANNGNYKNFSPQHLLAGGGMAGENGPTRGRGHPRYVGVVTTDTSTNNQTVFEQVQEKLAEGKTILVPIAKGKFALGTGLALKWFQPEKDWYCNQLQLFTALQQVMEEAHAVEIPLHVFWADCLKTDCTSPGLSNASPHTLPLQSIGDISVIKEYLKHAFDQ